MNNVYKIDHFETDSDNGVIYIDVHYPIIEYGKVVGAENVYGPPEFWGKTNLSNGYSVQVFKFFIKAKTLEQAIKKYDKELEENLKKFENQQKKKIIL